MGEMLVTLDDVSLSLLQLPILGQFCIIGEFEFEEAWSTIVKFLGIDHERDGVEMTEAHSSKFKLIWLRDICIERYKEQQWEYAARAYLLRLVGCTIFANKSVTSIRVSYLLLLRDLRACDRNA